MQTTIRFSVPDTKQHYDKFNVYLRNSHLHDVIGVHTAGCQLTCQVQWTKAQVHPSRTLSDKMLAVISFPSLNDKKRQKALTLTSNSVARYASTASWPPQRDE
ncbi:hypothetical protein BYT27DRAFT_6965412 [Phlegmacium glaucopus]|nr:hypothetical protein BYT27DRAFT_6965412 [Phlegmacium glaucopus]